MKYQGFKIFMIHTVILSLYGFEVYAQAPQSDATNRSIAEIRKGELVVKAKPGDKIKIEQVSHAFWFGCAIANQVFDGSLSDSDIREYKKVFLENFNAAVTENALKWHTMEPERGKVNYAVVDAILEWTDANGLPLRGHNIFWGVPNRVQPWVKELNDEELEATLRNRAEAIALRYKGRFAEYDLNNEMIHGNYYETRLGPDITKRMARWIHDKDPQAKLYLNDYDITTGKRLSDYMQHIRTLLAQGVPLAGIGVQGHLHSDTFDRNELKRSLDSLAVFNLPVCITEFNMPGQRSVYYEDKTLTLSAEEEIRKANEMTDFYRICFAHPAVKGILMWGFMEGANWIPASSLYKRDRTPTPAAKAYKNLVFNEWWTNESGVAGKNGAFATSAFYGKYKITVNGISKMIDFDSTTKNNPIAF